MNTPAINVLLLIVFPLVNCTIHVTRKKKNDLYNHDGGEEQECDEKSFFSTNHQIPNCQNFNELGCLEKKKDKDYLMKSKENFQMEFMVKNSCFSTNISTAFLWNLGINGKGTWMKLSNVSYFSITNNRKKVEKKRIKISTFPSRDRLKGHLIRLNLSCGECLAFKIKGATTYPFNGSLILPELFQKPKVSPSSSRVTIATKSTKTPSDTTQLPTPSAPKILLTASPSRRRGQTILRTPSIRIRSTLIMITNVVTKKPSPTTATSSMNYTTGPASTSIRTSVNMATNTSNRIGDRSVGLGVIVALVVVCLILIILVLIIMLMCRKRINIKQKGSMSQNEKTSLTPVNENISLAPVDENVYLAPVDENVYLAPIDGNVYLAPEDENVYLAPVDTAANLQCTQQNSTASLENAIANPSYQEEIPLKFQPQRNVGGDDLYACIPESNYTNVDDVLPRDASVRSDNSSTTLMNKENVIQKEEENYMQSPEPPEDSEFEKFTENYEQLPNPVQPTYEDLTTKAKPSFNSSSDQRNQQKQEGEYTAINKNNKSSEENYQDLDVSTRSNIDHNILPLDKEDDGIVNLVYEEDNLNYYHTLEAP